MTLAECVSGQSRHSGLGRTVLKKLWWKKTALMAEHVVHGVADDA
jgi:hypothetical protein